MMNYTEGSPLRPFPLDLLPEDYVVYDDGDGGDYGCFVRYVDESVAVSVFLGDQDEMIMLAANLAERVDVASTTPFVVN